MKAENEVSQQESPIEKFIYAFFVALLAYLVTNQLIGMWFSANPYAGYLFIMSLPAVFILSALSFIFYKQFKAKENLGWRMFIYITNSFSASVLGLLITYPFVAK